MASVRRVGFSRDLARLFGSGTVAGLGEGQLLDRFAVDGDEVAFEAIVARHGPMVLGVCRRSLRDEHAAEDAFQATFLVLARKAGTLRRPDRLGPWLHGVARKISARSRAVASRREAREARACVPDAVDLPPDADLHRQSVAAAIHDEIARLPESYRAPIVLCSLQGLSHDEAARHLAWPVGTVRGRLARARALLKSRLARRGFGLAAGGLAVELSSATAAVSPRLIAVTASLAASARMGSTGMIPAAVSFLSQGALSAMFHDKLIKLTALAATALGISAAGVGVLAEQGPPETKPKPPAVRNATGAGGAEEGRPEIAKSVPSAPDVNPTGVPAADPEAVAESLDQAKTELEILEVAVQQTKERMILALRTLQAFEDSPRYIPATPRTPEGGPFGDQPLNNEDIARMNAEHIKSEQDKMQLLTKKFSESRMRFRDLSLELGHRKRNVASLESQLKGGRPSEGAYQLTPPRKIRPGDILLVEVLVALPGRPISGERIVKGDGTITLGFYGDVSVAGLTIRDAKVLVIEHLRKHLKDETLGLLAVPEGSNELVPVAPADSVCVFVDNISEGWDERSSLKTEALERRLDRIEKLMRAK